MEDYITQAKTFYLKDVGKQFSFELCWKAVKDLPKFCIESENFSNEMKRALDLDDEKAEEGAGNSPLSDPKKSLKMASRPEIGKKKAKKLKFEKSGLAASPRDAIFERIAKNNEQRAQNQRDHFNLKLFMLDPNSNEAKEFITIKQKEALKEARIQMLQKQQVLDEMSSSTACSEVNAIGCDSEAEVAKSDL